MTSFLIEKYARAVNQRFHFAMCFLQEARRAEVVWRSFEFDIFENCVYARLSARQINFDNSNGSSV